MNQIILDVREKDEFEAEHIENSIHIPLSSFSLLAPGILNRLEQREVLIMCRSGNRARMALTQITQIGYADKVKATVYDGGILEWKKQGKPTILRKKGHLSIMRQVQLTAGLLVFTTTLLGVFASPWFFAITAFVGAGLTMAGATGLCPMANLLAVMPWNKSDSSTQEELCQVSPKTKDCCN